jgi:elongation factor Ts
MLRKLTVRKILPKQNNRRTEMVNINAQLVKELRVKTGVGMMDCKEALTACEGDIEKAVDFLRKKGLATAQKRAGRATSEGIVQSYIHMGGKIGVLVEVNCETDFVAKTDDFKEFAKNISMQIAATNPAGIKPEDVSQDIIEREKEIYRSQALETGKPENIVEKIVEGKMSKFYKESCLLNQAYVKNPDITIADLINETVAKIGESVSIKQFARFQIGES